MTGFNMGVTTVYIRGTIMSLSVELLDEEENLQNHNCPIEERHHRQVGATGGLALQSLW